MVLLQLLANELSVELTCVTSTPPSLPDTPLSAFPRAATSSHPASSHSCRRRPSRRRGGMGGEEPQCTQPPPALTRWTMVGLVEDFPHMEPMHFISAGPHQGISSLGRQATPAPTVQLQKVTPCPGGLSSKKKSGHVSTVPQPGLPLGERTSVATGCD